MVRQMLPVRAAAGRDSLGACQSCALAVHHKMLPCPRGGQGNVSKSEVPRSKLGGGTRCFFFFGFLGTKVMLSSLFPHGAVFDPGRMIASQFLLDFIVLERYSLPLCPWVRNP